MKKILFIATLALMGCQTTIQYQASCVDAARVRLDTAVNRLLRSDYGEKQWKEYEDAYLEYNIAYHNYQVAYHHNIL